jgi:hypothetical protein
MKLALARLVLAVMWCVPSLFILLIVSIQTLHEGYGTGDQSDKGLLWILPALMPQVSTVLTSSVMAKKSKRLGSTLVSKPVFLAMAAISVLYLAVVYATVWIGVFQYRNENWDNIFRTSGWILIILQGAFFGAYTAYFAEKA